MYTDFQSQLRIKLAEISNAGLFRGKNIISDKAVFEIDGEKIYNFRNPNFFASDYFYVDNQIDAAIDIFAELENRIAKLLNTESCLLLGSLSDVYQVISLQLFTRSDAIIFDTPSLYQLNAANCKATKYKFHNADLTDIEKQLKLSQAQQNRLLIVDAVSIASGNIVPLNQLFALADKYHSLVAIDQTYSAGLLGANGGGVGEVFELSGKAEIEIGTLTKAFNCKSGAYIAGRKEIIDFLRQQCNLPTLSAAISKNDAQNAISAINHLKENISQRNYLQQIANFAIRKFYGLGFDIAPTQTNTVSIIVGNNQKAELFAQYLQKSGVLTTCLTSPLIDKDNARIVLQFSAQHTQNDVEQVAEIFKKVAKTIRFFDN